MARIVSGPQITGQVRNKQTGSSIGPVTVTVNQTVYTDAEFTTATTTLTTDGQGRFSCYAEPGTYTFTSTEPLVGPIESVEVLSPDMGARSGTGKFLTSADASAAYVGVGQTGVDVSGKYGGDLVAAITAEGAGKRYWLTAPVTTVQSSVLLGTNTALQGMGQGITTIKAGNSLTADIITNSDHPNGNAGITIKDLTVDGSGPTTTFNRNNISLWRSPGFVIDSVESAYADRDGFFITGNAQVTRGGMLSNLYAHNAQVVGIRTTAAAREIMHSNCRADFNGTGGQTGAGFHFDASEVHVEGCFADQNQGHGIIISNVFGCSFSNMVATRSGRSGITAWAMVDCTGTNWRAMRNSMGFSGTYHDLYFAVGAQYTFPTGDIYGHTGHSRFAGMWAGMSGNFYADAGTVYNAYNMYVDDLIGQDGPVEITDVHVGDRKGLTGYLRLPTQPGRLTFREAAGR